MKKIVFLAAFLSLALLSQAQNKGYYTRYYPDSRLAKTAQNWMDAGGWRNGFDKASPDRSVNAVEFYEQYQKNPEQWKALFKWLQNTDLLTIAGGNHPIEGTSLVASVQDDTNGSLESRRSESHYHHVDFQFAVKGVERFGIIDHYTSKPYCRYDRKRDVIHYDYIQDKTRFYDSKPSHFFLFFPGDWHIAKVNNDTSDQNIRVIVIKVDYKK